MPYTPPAKATSKVVRSALNQLVVACRDEELALEAAATAVLGTERRLSLQRQSRRRVLLRRDLGRAVVALGGVPPNTGSRGARLFLAMWRTLGLVVHRLPGEDYDACARATDNTARAFSNALSLELPPNVRRTLAPRKIEVDSDRQEIRRLRRGGGPTSLTLAAPDARRDNDRRALETWGDDGGTRTR
jgi:hypothetical protein